MLTTIFLPLKLLPTLHESVRIEIIDIRVQLLTGVHLGGVTMDESVPRYNLIRPTDRNRLVGLVEARRVKCRPHPDHLLEAQLDGGE